MKWTATITKYRTQLTQPGPPPITHEMVWSNQLAPAFKCL